MIATLTDFQAARKIAARIESIDARIHDANADHARTIAALQAERAEAMAHCPHPITNRPCAEADTVCEICHAKV